MTTMIAEHPVSVAETNAEPLLPVDRCDRCMASALVRVEFKDGRDMLFCMHDFRKHESKLQEIGARAWNADGKSIQFGLNQVDFYKSNTPSVGTKELDHA